jgi:hypothetical protein
MDIQSVLTAIFPVATIEPSWQHELLLQLGGSDPPASGRNVPEENSRSVGLPTPWTQNLQSQSA